MTQDIYDEHPDPPPFRKRRIRCFLGFHRPRGTSLPGGSTVVFYCDDCGRWLL